MKRQINMVTTCEACGAAPAEIEEDYDGASPFRVCAACHNRLVNLSLRPREWFNLAKRHGWWQFLLHDDFYGEDGTAYQPKFDLVDPDSNRAPTLQQVANDPDALLDYTITRWQLRPEVAEAWQMLNHATVLETLQRRYAQTRDIDIQAVVLEVAAHSLGEHGQRFVSVAWNDFRKPRQLGAFAQASVACLTFEDGFGRVVAALSSMAEKDRRNCMYALSYFHRAETLDWIESNVFSPVTEDWGRLAAASQFDWDRAVAWLAGGRLLSLVALDALAAIVRPQTPLLREFSPELANKPTLATFDAVLAEYMERDPAPRVKMTTRFLTENAQLLCNS
jgi:hypothetical protein